MQFARSLQKAICLLVNPSNLPKVLQSWQQFWTSPETRARSRKIRLQRLGGHAQVQRILRTRHEYLGVIVAAESMGRPDDSPQ